MKCKQFGHRVSDSQPPLQILFWDTSRKILAAAQLVYDINKPWSSLRTRRHIRNKDVNSQQIDSSGCLWRRLAVGKVGVVGRRRGRLTVWLIVEKSFGRVHESDERDVYWIGGNVTHLDGGGVVGGDADWHVCLSFGGERERARGSGVIHHKPGTYCSRTIQKPKTLLRDQMSSVWTERHLRHETKQLLFFKWRKWNALQLNVELNTAEYLRLVQVCVWTQKPSVLIQDCEVNCDRYQSKPSGRNS